MVELQRIIDRARAIQAATPSQPEVVGNAIVTELTPKDLKRILARAKAIQARDLKQVAPRPLEPQVETPLPAEPEVLYTSDAVSPYYESEFGPDEPLPAEKTTLHQRLTNALRAIREKRAPVRGTTAWHFSVAQVREELTSTVTPTQPDPEAHSESGDAEIAVAGGHEPDTTGVESQITNQTPVETTASGEQPLNGHQWPHRSNRLEPRTVTHASLVYQHFGSGPLPEPPAGAEESPAVDTELEQLEIRVSQETIEGLEKLSADYRARTEPIPVGTPDRERMIIQVFMIENRLRHLMGLALQPNLVSVEANMRTRIKLLAKLGDSQDHQVQRQAVEIELMVLRERERFLQQEETYEKAHRASIMDGTRWQSFKFLLKEIGQEVMDSSIDTYKNRRQAVQDLNDLYAEAETLGEYGLIELAVLIGKHRELKQAYDTKHERASRREVQRNFLDQNYSAIERLWILGVGLPSVGYTFVKYSIPFLAEVMQNAITNGALNQPLP